MCPNLVSALCGLQPCCSKISKMASEFGVSSRVAKMAVVLVISALWARRSRMMGRFPFKTVEVRANDSSFGVGEGREVDEVHVRRIVST